VQDGRVIFSMLASFTERVAPGVLDAAGNRAERYRDPDECPRYLTDPHLEARQVTEMRTIDDRRLHPDALWLRVPEALPDTPLARAAALTYLSDLGSGYGQMQQADIGTGGSSLDHAMWFHGELDVHDWIVLDMWPVSAVNGRGVYHGVLRDRHGCLGATMVQELLLRPPGTDR
jgi:acyl-CoA thioesterase-2